MIRFRFLAAAVALLVLPSFALAASWRVDPDHSNIGFKVRHLMVSNVKGSFAKVAGTAVIDDRNITRSNVKVSIETASITTGVTKRDDHLKSPEFLDVEKYPTMTFVSKRIVARRGGDRLQVIGDLTLHGVTKEVVLEVEGPSAESKDPMGNFRRGASATTSINRKDFGLLWNKLLETGGVAVGDEVQITLEVEMIKEQPK